MFFLGALITGMDNQEVAHYLLLNLPKWFEGVVYLDRHDRQMILLRNSGRSMLLNQCGVRPDRRFTFYDQVHTTGMDIKQAPSARAVLTLGKDMTFRDYAQGAYRYVPAPPVVVYRLQPHPSRLPLVVHLPPPPAKSFSWRDFFLCLVY